jgi:hypothetical protein
MARRKWKMPPMTAHHIKLQSTVGDFSPEFVKELPALEKAMVDHGIDPANFVIAKDMERVTPLTIASMAIRSSTLCS